MASTEGSKEQTGSESEAFRRLYPELYLAKFIAEGVRPDGRPLGRPRPISVGLNSITTADASALVKIGSATALACIKMEVMQPTEEDHGDGQILTTVEMTPMCSADTRPGRPSHTAQVLSYQVDAIVQQVVDASQLCIDKGRAAWLAYLDIYILAADGSLLDVSLLAAVAALASLTLPQVEVNEEGKVVVSAAPDAAASKEIAAESRHLSLSSVPVSTTCGYFDSQCLVDPTAAEEPLLSSAVSVVLDAAGDLLGFYKLGGAALDSTAQLQDCIAHCRLRHREVVEQLERSVGRTLLQPSEDEPMRT